MNVWMRGVACGVLVLMGGVTLAQHEAEKDAAKPSLTAAALCPVTGEPVNLAVSTESPEGPVYFCCSHCIAKYEGDRAKYAEKVAAQRKALANVPKAQVLCPACKKPADRKVALESGGEKILFCSEDCMSKYKAEPATYASALASQQLYLSDQVPGDGGGHQPEVLRHASERIEGVLLLPRLRQEALR